jgi:pseudaminic acid cytidylyltransferase
VRKLKLVDLMREKAEDMDICVIPARGGSKRIPRKNIRSFAGKPMIAHSIEVALRSNLFDDIVVSTDDVEIMDIALEYGASVPFIRSTELADDYTPTVPVIVDAIQRLQNAGLCVSTVCCIYPCAPFLSTDDLVTAKFLVNDFDKYVYPICEYPASIFRSLICDDVGNLAPAFPENEWTRSQDLPVRYFDAGQFYWAQADVWLNGLGLQKAGFGISIPPWRVVDIDTQADWERAEKFWEIVKSQHDV